MNEQSANYKGQKNPSGIFIDNPDVIQPPAGNRLVSALPQGQGKFAAAGGSLFKERI